MAILLATCVTAFLVSFITLPVIIKYSLSKNLVDVPGRRKIHKKVTPSMGGIAIFSGFIIGCVIWLDLDQWTEVRYVVGSLFIVFLLGVRDDLVPFRALHKLFGQIIAVTIFLFSPIQITSLYGFLGIGQLPLVVQYLLTAFTVILITNSFNLIDGLDGLAGSLGMVALVSFGIWFFLAGEHIFSLLSFCMAGGILAFLVFNWEPSEIFMGDTGAMVIGMTLAIMAIHLINVNETLPEQHLIKTSSPIATAACFIIIPLCDTLRIIILRISKGKSPFTPDKSHIHHAIMRLGMSHGHTALILASVNMLFIFAAYLFRDYSDHILVAGIVLTTVVLSYVLDRLIIRKLSSKPQGK